MGTKKLFLLLVFITASCLLFASSQSTRVQAILGDVDISGPVVQPDLAILDAAYGSRSTTNPVSPNWDWRADLNRDQYVNLSDLTFAGRSFGDAFNFHWQRRVSNGRLGNPQLSNPFWVDAAADKDGRVHVIWLESTGSQTPLFYTVLDPAGNPLIEDVQISNDGDSARLAVDSSGSAHIVYIRRFSNVGLFYVRLDPQGRFTVGPERICISCYHPALATDEYNHAHLMYQQVSTKAQYTILDEKGNPLLPAARLNPAMEEVANAFAVAVGLDGARHILWRQATGSGGGDLRYTRITRDGIVTANAILLAHLSGTYNDRRYYLAVDSYNAAQAVYYDDRGAPGSIYWRRVNPDGSMSSEKLVTSNAMKTAGLDVAFTIDAADQIHLAAAYKTNGDIGYARLDRDGNILVPFQRAVFGAEGVVAITVDKAGHAMIVAPANSADSTGASPLFVVSTLADPAANDVTRADLVVDKAHISILNPLVKINQDADITVTVTNGGWAAATGNSLTFSYLLTDGSTAHTVVSLPDLNPYQSATVHQFIPVPDFEAITNWTVNLDAATATAETTTTNNQASAEFGIVPPPQIFNLEVTPFDETFSPDDRALAAPFPDARLDLSCSATGYNRSILSTQEFNVFWEIPLDMAPANGPLYPTTCQVTLSAAGYSSASATITAQRLSIANPYAIKLSSALPLALYINSWGSVSGQVSSGGVPLKQAQVTLDLGQSGVTDDNGMFTIQKIPAGMHTAQVWHRGHEPIPALPVLVNLGSIAILNPVMAITHRADVSGRVLNEKGVPLADATVTLRGDPGFNAHLVTGPDGAYSLSVSPYEDYSNYRIETTRASYDPDASPIPGLYPGWPLQFDVVLTYTSSGNLLEQHGSFTSWGQDESWCKSYGNDVPWNVQLLEFIGSEWCPDYQVAVDWGQYDYSLALDYTTDVNGNTVTSLEIAFDNEPFTSYDVSSGRWSGGGESRSVTGERIDWVEMVALDGAGNAIELPLMSDGAVWYSTEQADPEHVRRVVDINTLAPDWSVVGIRVFYTVGQYVASAPQHHWLDWAAPADISLAGSGGASGANRQVFTWWLESDTLEQRYSLADYRSALNPTAGIEPAAGQPAALPLLPVGPAEPLATSISLVQFSADPVRVGSPLVVDLVISGFDTRPLYGIEFDLVFNKAYLRLVSIQCSPDFGGTAGCHSVPLDVAAINAAGKVTNAAAVRLGALFGLNQGKVVRLTFIPLKVTSNAITLSLQNLTLADLESDLFTPDHVINLSVGITHARVYLPLTRR